MNFFFHKLLITKKFNTFEFKPKLMGLAATPLQVDETDSPSEEMSETSQIDVKELINNTHSEELILSLCGYIGTDIHGVALSIAEILKNTFNYSVEIIKLSDFIRTYSDLAKGISPGLSKFQKTKILIDGGNELRSKYGNDILAQLSIQKISFERVKANDGNKAFKTRRRCIIIDSIKNSEELDLLKMVYRDIHFSIGIFSTLDIREDHLRHSTSPMNEIEISQLINRDSGEELEHGQQVRDTFVQSDYFLRLDSAVNESVEVKLKRFLHLIFGSKVITPTIDETAMYQASSAASNSACLSRQVGAALTDSAGEVLSIGWNDVPKAGGGLYQQDVTNDPTSKQDKRCFNIGGHGCWNDEEKNIMADELVNILITENLVDETNRAKLFSKIRSSKIKSLVEFSRAIHAEMHAIITASQTSGNKVKDGSLYITTYPCHNCARHIIVAGIKKVYYIEPYRKSLTIKLHSDAITEKEGDSKKVTILMYDGVAPARYMELFKMKPNSRKVGHGEIKHYDLHTVKPKTTLSLEAIPVLELAIAKELDKKGLKIA